MRTTVTLDPDVDALISRSMEVGGISFKEALNAAVRKGLTSSRRPRFKQTTSAMGFHPGIAYDKALRIAGALEDEEILRDLATGN